MTLGLRKKAFVFGAFLLTSAIMACSGDDGTANSSTSGSSSTGSGSSSSSSGGEPGVCPANTICLNVKLVQEPVAAGRVAVIWFQLSDDGPDPVPLIAYDA